MGLEQLRVVAIDGPAGAGKSSVARRVARELGYMFMDTGAMYRAIALGAVKKGIGLDETDALSQYLANVELTIFPGDDVMGLKLNDWDVTNEIRSPEMGKHASDYSALPEVRRYCSGLQRKLGEAGEIVCEGRDMGTVVFPDARWKIFLTASSEERARRRWQELVDRGETPDLLGLKNAIEERDAQDSGRKLAPLKPADDAVILDTTKLKLHQVVSAIITHVRS